MGSGTAMEEYNIRIPNDASVEGGVVVLKEHNPTHVIYRNERQSGHQNDIVTFVIKLLDCFHWLSFFKISRTGLQRKGGECYKMQ